MKFKAIDNLNVYAFWLVVIYLLSYLLSLYLFRDMLSFSNVATTGTVVNLLISIITLICLRKYNIAGWILFNLLALRAVGMDTHALYITFIADIEYTVPLGVSRFLASSITLIKWIYSIVMIILMNIPANRNLFKVTLVVQLLCLTVITTLVFYITSWLY